ncbi:unnamed protein product [Schistosoma spindalis]|nr:unnamed protein product [Schistosoma spindale]
MSTNLTPSSLRTSDLGNSELTNNLPNTTSMSNAELDLRDLGKQLLIGVIREGFVVNGICLFSQEFLFYLTSSPGF